MSGAPDRVASLDLIRGVAVLGILAVNIAGFAGPSAGAYTPNLPHAGTWLDHAAFAVIFVLFEGKMRALFSILFGASLLLFVEHKDENGEDGQTLQLRRLGWLAVFGYLHFLLLWWGDILFLYAVAGVAVLALRQLPSPALLCAALIAFCAWQGDGVFGDLPIVRAEIAAAHGKVDPAQARMLEEARQQHRTQIARETREYRSDFGAQVVERLNDRPLYPFRAAIFSLGETIPYMILGLVLLRSGFFSGGWRRRSLWIVAIGGLAGGGAATGLFAAWAWHHGFPVEAMGLAINYGLGFPHVAMAVGYAALLALAAPRLLATAPGRAFRAAGQVALSNYLGTSLLMGAIFYGWGLDRFGHYGRFWMSAFVLLGWAVMLAWSKPWLDRFRIGPMESLWRKLASGNLTTARK